MSRKDLVLVERAAYGGWQDCWRLSNGLVELVATAEVGPRIIHFGLAGGENELKTWPEQLGKRGGAQWRVYGGHRLWNAPEDNRFSTQPDNAPVGVVITGQTLLLVQPPEKKTGIQKEMEISLLPGRPAARVRHRLRNQAARPQRLSAWPLTVVRPGGRAVLPLPARGPHPLRYQAQAPLVLWPYTDLSDPRFRLTPAHVMLGTDPKRGANKLGLATPLGWMAYARAGHLLIKATRFQPGAEYPDFGCTHQAFTHSGMLELETLSPLALLKRGQAVEHDEAWWLFDGVPVPKGDADIARHILPKVALAKKA
jgi:hypothetical protein